MPQTTLTAILVDPFEQTVTQIEIEPGIEAIYAAIQARPFTCIDLGTNNNDTLYCDDEALIRAQKPTHFIELSRYPQPIAGRGLILGTDDEGESVSTKLTVDEVRTWVGFSRRDFLGTTSEEGEIDHPALGRAHVYKQVPHFSSPRPIEDYNGWVNRETWAVALHLMSTEGSNRWLTETFEFEKREIENNPRAEGGTWTADQALRYRLRDTVSGQVSEAFHGLLLDGDESAGADIGLSARDLRLMIADAGSLWRVDWDEIVTNLLDR